VFVILLALVTILLSVPIDLFMAIVMEEYAAKRPRMEDVKLSSSSWLGAEIPSLYVSIFATRFWCNDGKTREILDRAVLFDLLCSVVTTDA
jgi:ABC-type phosphate transport system permease subunit